MNYSKNSDLESFLSNSFTKLSETAQNIFATKNSENQYAYNLSTFIHILDEFCSEGKTIIDNNKQQVEDLHAQIETANKKFRSTSKFLNEQAIEHEEERQKFIHEIKTLKKQVSDSKTRCDGFKAFEEEENIQRSYQELQMTFNKVKENEGKLDLELKHSMSKIVGLHNIIEHLESEIEKRTLNEALLEEKILQMQKAFAIQERLNKTLEDKLKNMKNLHDHIDTVHKKKFLESKNIFGILETQLSHIEHLIDDKIKNLEFQYQNDNLSNPNSANSEDISVPESKNKACSNGVLIHNPINNDFVSTILAKVELISIKLGKHTFLEDSLLKTMQDLEFSSRYFQKNGTEKPYSICETPSKPSQCVLALQNHLRYHTYKMSKMERKNLQDLDLRIHNLEVEVDELQKILIKRDKKILQLHNQLHDCNIVLALLKSKWKNENNLEHWKCDDLSNIIITDKNEEIELLNDLEKLKEHEFIFSMPRRKFKYFFCNDNQKSKLNNLSYFISIVGFRKLSANTGTLIESNNLLNSCPSANTEVVSEFSKDIFNNWHIAYSIRTPGLFLQANCISLINHMNLNQLNFVKLHKINNENIIFLFCLPKRVDLVMLSQKDKKTLTISPSLRYPIKLNEKWKRLTIRTNYRKHKKENGVIIAGIRNQHIKLIIRGNELVVC